jgi:hypothetical protein
MLVVMFVEIVIRGKGGSFGIRVDPIRPRGCGPLARLLRLVDVSFFCPPVSSFQRHCTGPYLENNDKLYSVLFTIASYTAQRDDSRPPLRNPSWNRCRRSAMHPYPFRHVPSTCRRTISFILLSIAVMLQGWVWLSLSIHSER